MKRETVIERINSLSMEDETYVSSVESVISEYMKEYHYRDEYLVKVKNDRVIFSIERTRRDLTLLQFLDKFPARSKVEIDKDIIKAGFSITKDPYAQPRYKERIHGKAEDQISLGRNEDIPTHKREKNVKHFKTMKGL